MSTAMGWPKRAGECGSTAEHHGKHGTQTARRFDGGGGGTGARLQLSSTSPAEPAEEDERENDGEGGKKNVDKEVRTADMVGDEPPELGLLPSRVGSACCYWNRYGTQCGHPAHGSSRAELHETPGLGQLVVRGEPA